MRKELVSHNTPSPLFFVSVAAKRLRDRVNPLFATPAKRSISVAAKGLMAAFCRRESNRMGWEDLEGVRMTARREAIKGEAPLMAGVGATREVKHMCTHC